MHMVVALKLIEPEEAVQAPLIFDWPVAPRRPYIERWPVAEPSREDRVRALTDDPRPFRDWLQKHGSKIVGYSHDGTRCPWAMFVRDELGIKDPRGLYVNIYQTGVHACVYRVCGRYPHVKHSAWLSEFIFMVDDAEKARGVRGKTAVAYLDAAIAMTAERAGA
jgi:hypothetical protein